MILIKQLVRGLLHSVKLMVGFTIYLLRKETPAFAYQSMIGLFCLTSGRSNDLISRFIGLFSRPYHFTHVAGILGDVTGKAQRERVASILREKGFYIFENRLPEELCDRLLQYSTSNPCKLRVMDAEQLGKPISAIYHRDAPQAVRYEFDTQDLLNNKDVQEVLADLSFAAVAQDYLGSRPVMDVLGLWWHTAFSDRPDAEAAQYFHFDMDRPKWLKFFIYLTDVEPTSGPHTFISGSHQTGGIPSNLLSKGYSRLTDEEVMQEFDKRNVIEFAAPRGTIIAEDTRGLHKGKHVQHGDRLILQLQFSNSLFGGYYPKAKMENILCENLKNSIKKFPEMYRAYL